MSAQPKQSPRVATMLNKRLDELGLTRSDFIRKFHRDYGEGTGARNHLFKILNGQVVAGERGLFPLIIKSMGLDLPTMIQLLRADKIESKGWARSIPKANKIVQETATAMESLSKRDQEEVLRFVQMKAERR
jgi:hypothetical protein